MSGSPDYTLTPNLGLFKPNYDMDDGQWGYHLNTNADKLDTALGTGTGGMFLPLTGGAMTGALLLRGDPAASLEAASKHYVDQQTAVGTPPGGPFLPLAGGTVAWLAIATAGTVWQDSAPARLFNVHNAWTGTSTLPSAVDLNRILTVDSISAAAGSFGGGGFVTALNLESQTGGAASTGGRIALNVLQRQTASTGNFAAGGAYNGVAASFVAVADFNEGGTSFIPGGHTGSLFGINPAVALRNTATYFSELCGGEVNVTAHLGSSVFVKYGWAIVKEAADAVQGAAGMDSALAFSDQLGAQPWDYGILFGNEGGQWAFDANATLMGTRLNTSQGTGGAIGTAKWVMDFLPMTTTGGLLRGTGFVIENTGITRVGFGALKPDPAGMLIDIEGKQAASATIAAGGSNYTSGGYWPDVNGNVWHIDSVGGGGNVTGVTLTKAVVTGTQSTPIALAPSPYLLQATGAVLNVTYVSGSTLSLQPSGGATVFGGPVTLPSGTVTGAITSRQYLTGFPPVVFSGNTVPLPIAILTGAVSGSTTLSASTTVGLRLGTAGDTLTSSTGYGVHFLNINYNNGAGMNGVRAGIIGNMQIATPTTFSRVTDGLIGISFTMAGSASTGGTTAPGGSRGQLFAANLAARIDPGVTGWNGCVGGEVNTGVAAGGAVAQHVAWQVIQFSTHAVQGYLTDAAIRIGAQSQSTPGWRNGITIGDPYSEWPISRTNGYLFQSEIGVSSDTCAAAGGFDVQQVDFTGMAGANGGGFAFRADGVQLLPGTPNGGGVQAGYATLMGSATGAALDCNYQQMSGTPTVNSGGTGWNVGDVAAGANSIVKVTTVTGGAVTAVVVLKRGWMVSGPATATFTIKRPGQTMASGTGLVLGLTWAQAITLALQPSGGTVQVGTGCIAANGSVATVLGSLGPVGSHTAVQEWIAIKNASGVTRYIPAF